MSHTPGPWFVSGVRYRMNGGEWHNVNRYDEAKKQDENIACVGYDPRTGVGMDDAKLIAKAPEMLDFIQWIETWVSNPAASYSTDALDGLFGMARDRLSALLATDRSGDK